MSNDININSNRDLQNIGDQDVQEISRVLFNLRQRFRDSNNDTDLVLSAKYFEEFAVQKNLHISVSSLTDEYLKKVAKLGGMADLMDYQKETWEKIHYLTGTRQESSIIVSAETGMGKTEAVIPSVLEEVIENDSLAILIFPRRALLKDQLQRIAKFNTNFSGISGSGRRIPPLKMSLQMGEISEKIYWTAYNQDSIDETAPNSYTSFENEFFSVERLSDEFDRISLLDIKCPICGNELSNEFKFKKGPRGYGRDSRNIQANYFKAANGENYTWKCEKHPIIEYWISFSREDHVSLKPNVLFTTIDSLESLLLDPEMGRYILSKVKYLVLDEVHVYNGIYGTHASAMIEEFKKMANNPIITIGLSATINRPKDFAHKLFNTPYDDIYPIFPSNKDKEGDEEPARKKFLMIKAKFHDTKYYPLQSQVMIQSALFLSSSLTDLSRQTLVFMDSIDAVTRLKRQTEDAFNALGLHQLRLDDLSNGGGNFRSHPCLGFKPDYSCSSGCFIYEQGECWLIPRDRNGIITPSIIDVRGVTARAPATRTELENSRVIYSTSELELGVDLRNIGNLFQYGSPFSTASLIQRIGRAGRSAGSEPLIGLVLGEKTNDYIYYRKGSDILHEPLPTPLNEGNEVIKKLHENLIDISMKAIRVIENDNGTNKSYVKEIVDTWTTIYNEFGSKFQDALHKLNIQALFSGRAGWDDIKVFKRSTIATLDRKVKGIKEEIQNKLLQDQQDPRDLILQKSEQIEILLTGIGIDVGAFKDKVSEYLNEYTIPIDQRDLEGKLAALKKEYFKIQAEVGNALSGQNNDQESEILNTLFELYKAIESLSQTSEQITDEIRQKFYQIQSLNEFIEAFGKSSLIEIVKSATRAKYFLEVSDDFFNLNVDPPFPDNLFQLNRYYCIAKRKRRGDIDKISIDDAMTKYFPFRVNSSPNSDSVDISLPKIESGSEGTLQFSLNGYIDYVHQLDSDDEAYAFPRTLEYETYNAEHTNGLLKFCDHCVRFYSYAFRNKCISCGGDLHDARPYATPNIDSKIESDEWVSKTKKVYIASAATIIKRLVSVSLNVTPALRIKGRLVLNGNRSTNYTILAEVPYGYFIKTTAVRINVTSEIVDSMISEYKKEFPILSSSLSDLLLRNIAMHTVSHLWVILSADVSEVSANAFSYDWESSEDGYFVKIAEDQEGGAGFLDEIIETIKTDPIKIFERMSATVNCDEHASISSRPRVSTRTTNSKEIYDWIRNQMPGNVRLSERQRLMDEYAQLSGNIIDDVIPEYPTCVDGCNNCIATTECHEGILDQLDHISLSMARVYVDSLTKIITSKDDAADLIKNGEKVIEEIDNGNGGYRFLDL